MGTDLWGEGSPHPALRGLSISKTADSVDGFFFLHRQWKEVGVPILFLEVVLSADNYPKHTIGEK